ncbi:hypothetical protein [Chitinophaga qingshengii]|uniref:DUF5590 domain-containing protein n=1 Tax=Chitinophaga qingshengii TaxID=1569794 RepID=A0ABR7TIJ8_9BACT|nr:hypothetical protein [Chitinophaga qingshengii]MBC9930274.1 hypothetical protein [Chitinophaga qingshengii]
MALRKKTKIWILVAAVVLAIIGVVYYYSFAIVLWIFTPPVSKLTAAEKNYLDSLRTTYNCQSIWREPNYFMNDTARKTEYAIIMTFAKSPAGLETDSLKQDSLKQEAFKIARHAYWQVVNKSPKFPECVASFYYDDSFRSYHFTFTRQELEGSYNNHIGH